MKKLSRHNIDLVARAVVTGKRGSGKRLDRLADEIAGLMKNRLAATQAPGANRVWRKRVAAAPLPGRETLDPLLRRIEKHLASLVLAHNANDHSHTR